MNTETARFNMIEQQIRPWEVLDPGVLSLLSAVRREDFVPAHRRALAFMDLQVPLAEPVVAGQCMLEPKVEARLLQELAIQRHEVALEIGTGSGFMAALLAHRAMRVTTLECVPAMVKMARQNLARAGLNEVDVVQVSAEQGAAAMAPGAEPGPWDVILLSGSVADVPRALLQQLKPGGRLAAVVGHEPVMVAKVYTRTGDDAFAEREVFDTVAPRLLGFAEPPRFAF
jgi:protein-L-isoaspartate(D-aspartate) O-methyltransferase